MHGNAAEWCEDRHVADYYSNSPAENPVIRNGSNKCVVRGGSYESARPDCRSAVRGGFVPKTKSPLVGFRVVCEVKQP